MRRLIAPCLMACALLASPAAHAQTGATSAIEPARLAAARQVALKVVPEGALARLMNGMSEQMGSMIVGQLDSMPLGKIAKAVGADEAKAAKLDKLTISQINSIVDPHYKERTERGMKAMFAGIGDIVGKFEPDVREAMALAYARRFTVAQLGEINAFIATPTGALFASSNMEMAADPEYLKVSQKLMPAMVQEMPGLLNRVQKATADLPPAREYKDLSDAEKKKLEALFE